MNPAFFRRHRWAVIVLIVAAVSVFIARGCREAFRAWDAEAGGGIVVEAFDRTAGGSGGACVSRKLCQGNIDPRHTIQ